MAKKYLYIKDREQQELLSFVEDIVTVFNSKHEDELEIVLKNNTRCMIEYVDRTQSDAYINKLFDQIKSFICTDNDQCCLKVENNDILIHINYAR